MEFLEVLTEGLERVLLVRGGGREVITIFSWSSHEKCLPTRIVSTAGRKAGTYVFFLFVKNGLLNAKEVYSILVEYWDTLL